MRIGTTTEGFAEINRRIDELQEKAGKGMLNPAFSQKYLQEIRSDLFGLRQTLIAEVTVSEQ